MQRSRRMQNSRGAFAPAPPPGARAQRCVGLQNSPDALAPMRLSSPTGLTLPSHSGWKRAFVYGSSTKRLPLAGQAAA